MSEKQKGKDWSQTLRMKGKCCSCEGSLKGSEGINLVMIDKYTQWEFPAWGNMLLPPEHPKAGMNRAMAACCDHCVDPSTGKAIRPVKLALEVNLLNDKILINYHKVEDLTDAPPITKEDLIIGKIDK